MSSFCVCSVVHEFVFCNVVLFVIYEFIIVGYVNVNHDIYVIFNTNAYALEHLNVHPYF